MGISSDRFRDFVDTFILARSFDTKIITSCVCIQYVDVVCRSVRGKLLALRLDDEDDLVSHGN